jgi:carbon monoxide dehydrogenase subunit G
MKSLFTESAHINKNVGDVFDFVAKPENFPRFVPAILLCEMVGDGGFGAGTRLRETRTVFGKEATAEVEVSRYDVNKCFAVKSEAHGIFGEYVYEFDQEGYGTRLRITANARVTGLLKILSPIFTSAMKKDAGQAARIKELLENEE